jgi:hypothetical protein
MDNVTDKNSVTEKKENTKLHRNVSGIKLNSKV